MAAPPFRGRTAARAVTPVDPVADVVPMMLQTTVHAPALSRAHGSTAALWHAVELHRPAAEIDGACELTVCGSLARVSPDDSWPRTGTDVCPACAALAG
ncbi:hypothetical protein SAMN05660662_3983 [Blastococcus aurantiacus]|uniref:Uncharacterized protein n=1 Tax=Blastococcus aurantiacus TaxID=1550231 RepID=A0A1G7QFG0_9ACTN|nr:hypothetical protein [Blastococcus aurantiacus]SDF97246.1 hypothetical protein SAMN05660662_3983 [Blastococcus aurantiacus]